MLNDGGVSGQKECLLEAGVCVPVPQTPCLDKHASDFVSQMKNCSGTKMKPRGGASALTWKDGRNVRRKGFQREGTFQGC